MYSGIFNITDDNQLAEALGVTDFYNMAALKDGLEVAAKKRVKANNVLSYRSIADLYRLPNLMDMCERVQLVKFADVMKGAEFLALTKDDMVEYMKKCADYSGISEDELLQAVLLWMDNNEPSMELMQMVKLQDCSKEVLQSASRHNAMPQEALELICKRLADSSACSKTLQTMAYVTRDKFYIEDKFGYVRELHGQFCAPRDTPMQEIKGTCSYDNGYVWITKRTLLKFIYSDNSFETIHLRTHIQHEIQASIVHQSKLYYVDTHTQSLECYDFETKRWSNSHFARCQESKEWHVAAVANDLYFLNDELTLYILWENLLVELETQLSISEIEHSVKAMVAVDRWLYILLDSYCTEGELEICCWNTKANVWTHISTSGNDLPARWFVPSSVAVYKNKIYIIGSVPKLTVSEQGHEIVRLKHLYKFDFKTEQMTNFSKLVEFLPSTFENGEFMFSLCPLNINSELLENKSE